MDKDKFLVNIYLKIHNKRPITLDDLRYLAQYDPECFEKTCKNVVYNLPESKPIMNPTDSPKPANAETQAQPSESFDVLAILENLKRLEANEYFFANLDADRVKNLLGNLYMELLFPHNDKDTFFNMADDVTSTFDMKA